MDLTLDNVIRFEEVKLVSMSLTKCLVEFRTQLAILAMMPKTSKHLFSATDGSGCHFE
jgi:hypothetical protein